MWLPCYRNSPVVRNGEPGSSRRLLHSVGGKGQAKTVITGKLLDVVVWMRLLKIPGELYVRNVERSCVYTFKL